MDNLVAWCEWLEHTRIATQIRESLWVFPAIETTHLLAMIVFVGSIGSLDLRLLGLAWRSERVSQLTSRVLPWAITGFFVMALTGSLLFISNAAKLYVNNTMFQFKLGLIALAGINALAFHFTIYQRVTAWDLSPVTPLHARLAGAASLLLWIGVVTAGRWTGFV
jgi:hypothetical protein